MKLEFSRQIFKKYSYQISWKYVQWEPSCSMRTDTRTDMTKLIVAFRNFADAPKYQMLLQRCYKPRNPQTMVLRCIKIVGEAHLMFVLIKKVHLVGITNGVCTVIICAVLGLNTAYLWRSYTGTWCHARRMNASWTAAKMTHDQLAGHRVGNSRRNWSDELW